MAGVAQSTVYRMRKEVDEKLARLPLKYYDSRTHGEILSRAVNDMDNISTTLQQNMTQLITSVVTLVGVIVNDVDDKSIADAGGGGDVAVQHSRHHADRETLPDILRESTASAWRTEWPRRGDVSRPQNRQGIRRRGQVD